MEGRTVILSDLHLGRAKAAARSAEALRPLWSGATRLVLNGDIAEVHDPRVWATAAREVLQDIIIEPHWSRMPSLTVHRCLLPHLPLPLIQHLAHIARRTLRDDGHRSLR